MMRISLQRGQQILEYLVVLTAIIAAIIAAAYTVIPQTLRHYVTQSAAVVGESAP